MLSCRKNCDAVFKYKTSRITHERDKCMIFGGDIDKRKKNEFNQACEASKKLDGTLLHASKIFEAITAIPKEHRKDILINGLDVKCDVVSTVVDTDTETSISNSSVVNNYNIQIIQNTQNNQNINTVIADSEILQSIREQVQTEKQSSKKVDEELKQILQLLANEKINTTDEIQEHIKDRVFTLEEIKKCIETDGSKSEMRRDLNRIITTIISQTTNSVDIVDPDGEKRVVDEIKNGPSECIWSMYQKLFLPVQRSGKIQLDELSRRSTRLSSKNETSCEILAFDTVDGKSNTEHVIWVKRHWNPLIKELIFAIGNRIFSVTSDEYFCLEAGKCHPFANWWKIMRTSEDLVKDMEGANLIKKITNALVQDCKDNLIKGWHRLIDCCSKLHFQSLAPMDEAKQRMLEKTEEEYRNNEKVMKELTKKFAKTQVYDTEMQAAFAEKLRLEELLTHDPVQTTHQNCRSDLLDKFLLNGIKG